MLNGFFFQLRFIRTEAEDPLLNDEKTGAKTMRLNEIQQAAYKLIQADARFVYTLIDIDKKAQNISSNYIMMCQPYIGVFADGAEQ